MIALFLWVDRTPN